MRILITGGAGFVGSALTQFLATKSWISKIHVVDKGMFGVDHFKTGGKICLHRFSLKDFYEKMFFSKTSISAVIHLSGLSNDPMADFDKNANNELNVVDTARTIQFCIDKKIKKLIFASSASIYGDLDMYLNNENGETNPHSNYAKSKSEAEELLHNARCQQQLNNIIFRKGTIHGVSPRMRFDLAVNTMVMNALKYGKIELYGGGENWRPIVDIRDVVRAYGHALMKYDDIVADNGNRIFNICSNNVRISELGLRVANITGAKLIPRYDMPKDIRDYRMDNSKFVKTGFKYIFENLDENINVLMCHMIHNKYDYDDPIYYNLRWIKNCQKCFKTVGKEYSLL